MKKAISIFCVLLVVGMFITITAYAAVSPNYATSTEHWSQLYYDGYVQVQPSFAESNRSHAVNGYIRYYHQYEDTGRLYTANGLGPNDNRILSLSHRFYENLLSNIKTQFNYGFTWAPEGTWPFSTRPATE